MNIFSPKVLLRVEGLVVCIGVCVLYAHLAFSWITFALFFLVPDISMLGFLASKKIGTICYNIFHTYSIPLLIFLGCVFGKSDFAGAGIGWHVFIGELMLIWMAHIGFDRLVGYGIKYETAFKDTHLQRV